VNYKYPHLQANLLFESDGYISETDQPYWQLDGCHRIKTNTSSTNSNKNV